jgi:hypothetical protein
MLTALASRLVSARAEGQGLQKKIASVQKTVIKHNFGKDAGFPERLISIVLLYQVFLASLFNRPKQRP